MTNYIAIADAYEAQKLAEFSCPDEYIARLLELNWNPDAIAAAKIPHLSITDENIVGYLKALATEENAEQVKEYKKALKKLGFKWK